MEDAVRASDLVFCEMPASQAYRCSQGLKPTSRMNIRCRTSPCIARRWLSCNEIFNNIDDFNTSVRLLRLWLSTLRSNNGDYVELVLTNKCVHLMAIPLIHYWLTLMGIIQHIYTLPCVVFSVCIRLGALYKFTLFDLPGRPVHSDTNSASPGSILAIHHYVQRLNHSHFHHCL